MKCILYSILGVYFFFSAATNAQAQKNEFTINLQSGKLVPVENILQLSAGSDVFRASLFKDKHFLAVQFYQVPSASARKILKNAGMEMIDYLSGNTYTMSLKKGFDFSLLKANGARSIFLLNKEHKASPEIISEKYPSHAVKEPGFLDVNAISYEKFSKAELANVLQKLGVSVIDEQPMFKSFVLRVPLQKLTQLIEEVFIQWVEPIDPPNTAENLLGRSLHNVNVLNDGVRNLKGSGVKVGIWDGGEIDKHLDFSGTGRLNFLEQGSTSSHGTHVAGTVGGSGLINPKARGMAPNATLYSADFTLGNSNTEIFNATNQLGLSISSHSYGGSVASCTITASQLAYSATSRNTDITLNTFPGHLHIHSAGNSQGSCTNGFYTITGSGKSAKNNIVVANIQSNDAISGSSSFGPVHDGRIKPEISAFGTGVLSTYTPQNTYASISGTSMSTPGVSGTLALLVERYRQLNNNADPLSSLIKALVCNTATDLGNPGPDYRFGFGKINALAAVRTMEDSRYIVNTVMHQQAREHVINVPAGAVRLKAMLTWNDPAAATNAATALVNNLDLSLINGTTVTLPWILNPSSPGANATRAVDNISNIEQVTIDNPAAGSYTIRVNGTSVPVGADQQYSITWIIEMPSIEITYPNGGESFDPADSETISWIATGITGTQTVQYSLDNGTTWTTLSTVSATATRLPWTIPDVNTSEARIRIFSGSFSDDSDNSFHILGTPKNLMKEDAACVAGTINLKWDAVNNATHYELLQLNEATSQWVTVNNQITGTSFSVTGLVGGNNYWFSVKARNNINNSVSERSIAVSAIASSAALAIPGSITGQTTVCSNSKGNVYSISSVPGAVSYIWKTPAGATISTGQGTTSVLVDFGTGALAGNISVYASNGICQTASSQLAITITPGIALAVTPVNPTICSPGSTVLTASAPGSTGLTYTWSPATGLNTTTGETVTASPTETTVYTVTASSTNGCSASLPVTVYVGNAASSISNSGPVCEGGQVQLFAAPAVSNKFASIKITEVVQFRDGTGSTPVYPFYVPGPTNAEDMMEISNVDNINPVDVSGMIFELWSGTTLNRSYTVPAGVIIPPNQVMVIYVGSSGTDNFENRFFRTGGSNNPVASSTPAGWVLKTPASGFIDVVATNGYVWPVASGVTTAQWSGNLPLATNLAGVIRTAAVDNNTSANWANASTTLIQSIGTYNGVYTNISPYSWTGPGGFVSTEQNPVRFNATAAMSGNYTITYVNGNNGCNASGTTSVVVNASIAPMVTASANFPICVGGNLILSANSTEAGSTFSWTGPGGFTSTLQNPSIPSIGYAQQGVYEVTVDGGGCTQKASVSIVLKQLKGVYKIAPGADYNSLTDALYDYNTASCIDGPVVFELTNRYNPAFESFPINIGNSPGASAVNTLTIRPAVGANPQVITAINGSAVIRFNGARYVTIDGRINGQGTESSMRIENLSTSNLAGTSAISLVNGAQFNTVNYVKVLNGTTNASQTAGNIIFGSATSVGNNNNTISNCFLAGSSETQTQMRYGIVCDGSNAARNSNNVISGNEFYSVVFRAMPLNAGLGNNWTISGNHFYWQGGTFSTAGPRPILMNNSGSSGHTISGNFIGGSMPGAQGSWTINTTAAATWYGMDLTLGTAEPTIISGNIIKNVSLTSSAANNGMIGIALNAGSYRVINNSISDLTFTSTGLNPKLTGIYYTNIVADNQSVISGNTISELYNNTSTLNNAGIIAIYQSLGSGEQATISRNKIYNLFIPNSASENSEVYAIFIDGTNISDVVQVDNNMITLGIGVNRAVYFYGLYHATKSSLLKAYYNTVMIGGAPVSGLSYSLAFGRANIDNETPLDVRNNIFHNQRSGGTGSHYAVGAGQINPLPGWSGSSWNYNSFYAVDNSTLVFWGGVDLSFQQYLLATGGDVNSNSRLLVFEDPSLGDLRIKSDPSTCSFDDLGTPIAGITTDFFNNTRSTSKPDIGAHEFTLLPAAVISAGSATDFCPGGSVTLSAGTAVSYAWSTGATTPSIEVNSSGNYTVTLTGANGCSATSQSITVTVEDILPPTVITQNITVNLNAAGTVTILPSQVNNGSSDNCSIPLTGYSLSKTEFTCAEIGANTVILTVTDANGNQATATAVVTVSDNIAPEFTAPAAQNITIGTSCSVSIPNLLTGLTGSDNCSAVNFIQSPLAGTALTVVHNQAITVTITATDASGNSTAKTITLTAKDLAAPSLTAPAAVVVNTNTGQCTAAGVALGTPVVSDNCAGTVVSNNAPSVFPRGVTTVTWTATDLAGNIRTATQSVTVNDLERPVIVCPVVASYAYNPLEYYTIPALTATDNCGTLTVSFTVSGVTGAIRAGVGNNASGFFNQGLNVINWTITDGSGNITTCSTSVLVLNKPEEPVFSVEAQPNPTRNFFTIRIQGTRPDATRVRIFNAAGVQLQVMNSIPANGIIRLGATYPSGMYFAEVLHGGKKIVVKMVKQ
jgi:hypothetical protein